GETGLKVPPGDPAALAAAISQLCREPETRKKMGERARAHVVQHFNHNRTVTELRKLYGKLAEEKGGLEA
ncbi:MAG: hypothetical protein R3330_12500, partial [Saprospiraceae bacterium]|nr:hypothetical protein [Saprospiraceae bacterium]